MKNYALESLLPVSIELVTPEMAKLYLNKNPRNRPISGSRVEYFTRLAVTDQFVPQVPDPIIFDKYGNLINGQHRLSMIVALGITVPCYVQRGAERDLIINLDQQKKRTIGQNAHIVNSGHSQKTLTSAEFLYSMYLLLTKGKSITNFKLSPNEIIRINDKFKEGLDYAERSLGVGNHAIAPIKAALARAYYEFDNRDKLFKFGTVYRTGEYESIPGIPLNRQPQFNAVKLQKWVEGLTRHERAEKKKLIYLNTEFTILKFMYDKRIDKLHNNEYELFHNVDEMFDDLDIV